MLPKTGQYARPAHAFDTVEPLSYYWGTDRGKPPHRYFTELFLQEHASCIRGRCLEFQENRYTTLFGGTRPHHVDILHVDGSNVKATIVADLTHPNDIPSGTFDCIICTFVLHVIFDLTAAVGEMHRILRPGGALLVAVPQVSMDGPEYSELWRFTQTGLTRLLSGPFGQGNVMTRAYGNALTTAGDFRGLVISEFTPEELNFHDPRFAMVVCAKATKGSASLQPE